MLYPVRNKTPHAVTFKGRYVELVTSTEDNLSGDIRQGTIGRAVTR